MKNSLFIAFTLIMSICSNATSSEFIYTFHDVKIVVGKKWHCRGIVVNQIVITAAHCIEPNLSYEIIGFVNGKIVEYEFLSYQIHPEYRKSNNGSVSNITRNDIAIINVRASSMKRNNLKGILSPNFIKKNIYHIYTTVNYDHKSTNFIFSEKYNYIERTHRVVNGTPIFNSGTPINKENGIDICSGDSGAPVYTTDNTGLNLVGIITKGVPSIINLPNQVCGTNILIEFLFEHKNWLKLYLKSGNYLD